ncbi:MAG: restriction endonuclease subunit S [Proteobacteria bacterium]|nr:restriction endonuclease subunit S [Pseudomonadota bacterium]MBU1387900.1 restriction endonuclease subunit S [Pseudomonadota bacterium]MBU1544346.1 restriction endonuclease subunit S [Pseudomonadota bacterium]MBU2430185.1 restriction endonuclease subunit S [Pseudomonadota bacterium]
MRIKTISSCLIEKEDCRLSAKPYFSGGIEARIAIERLQCENLVDLVQNHKKGIFNGPRFRRIFVDDPAYGIPLLSGSEMLQNDLSYAPLIAVKQANSMPEMILKKGITLISSYGSVGRCVYTRPDMVGMVGSDNVLKVLTDPEIIPQGYLYSFISSQYGIPQVLHGEGGAVVTYLDPSRVYHLKVPRLDRIEDYAHELVQKAADMRVEATNLLKLAGSRVNRVFAFPEKLAFSHRNFSCAVTSSRNILSRMEATYHDGIAQESDRLLDAIPKKNHLIGLGVSFGETGRLKQVFVEKEYGEPFVTSGEIFRQVYAPSRFLSKSLLPDDNSWATQEGDLLLARSGQVGGIIGRGVWADSRFKNACVSVDVIRISAQNASILPGYLYAYLFLTDVGYRQLIRTAAGSSIPHLSVSDVQDLLIPRSDDAFEQEINDMVWKAGRDRAEAQLLEEEARNLVEQAIKKGGPNG